MAESGLYWDTLTSSTVEIFFIGISQFSFLEHFVVAQDLCASFLGLPAVSWYIFSTDRWKEKLCPVEMDLLSVPENLIHHLVIAETQLMHTQQE